MYHIKNCQNLRDRESAEHTLTVMTKTTKGRTYKIYSNDEMTLKSTTKTF